ncbi:MAG TPA: hypothetical protein VMT34_15090 [Aggregatilineales bacterium]|nr:hypothetical protein [Aggregatilineales bacterium]
MNVGSSSPVRERGGCLTLYLVASIVVSILVLLLLLLTGAFVGVVNASGALAETGSPSIPIFPLLLDGVGVLVSVAGFVGAWTWKKWGIYLLVASFVISALGGLISGNASSAVLGLAVEVGILWYLIRDKWAWFEG